jgi:hypothetical protein
VSPAAVELVIERILLEGLELNQEQAGELRRLIVEELRPLVAGGGGSALPAEGVADVTPVALSDPPELRALARAVARRVVQRAHSVGGGHV